MKTPAVRRALIYGILCFWSFVCAFPIYWVVLTSLKSEATFDRGGGYLPFIDFTPSLRAWYFIFGDAGVNLLHPLGNSIFIACSSTALAMTSASLLLYAATRFPGGVPRLIVMATLSTRILAPAMLALPLYMMARAAGLPDSRIMLLLTYAAINLPVAAWLLRPIFGAQASEQEQSAVLDGASHLAILCEIVLPMAHRQLLAVGLLVFVLAWNEYLLAAFLATSTGSTLPVWMAEQLSMKEAQVGGGPDEWANMSAAATLMAAPLMFVTAWSMRAMALGALANDKISK